MRTLSVAVRKARALSTFSLLEIALLLPVFMLLGVARVAIFLIPFRSYARSLGSKVTLETTPLPLCESRQNRAKSIGRVVRSVAKITPWESLCLAQALVASFLMRLFRLPYCVFFGLAPNADATSPNPLDAHAWVKAGKATITGGGRLERYTVVQVFQNAPN